MSEGNMDEGRQFNQPVLLGSPEGHARGALIAENSKPEAAVLPIDRHAWKSREKTLKAMARQSRTVVKGGARVVKFNVSMPAADYHKLMMWFAGDTPSDKVNTIVKIANARIEQVQRERAAAHEAPAPLPAQVPATPIAEDGA